MKDADTRVRVDTTSKLTALALVILLAVNLRPAITVIGPVLHLIGEDLKLSGPELGTLSSLPLLAFALVSGLVQRLIARIGLERSIAVSLTGLTLATVFRSWSGPTSFLWVGTFLVGATVAIGNVAAPVLIKRSFPSRVATVTGIYVATLGATAGISAAVAVPLAEGSELSWRLALGVWAAISALAALVWIFKARNEVLPQTKVSDKRNTKRPTLITNATAWKVTLFMGVQSAIFYIASMWLPIVEQYFDIAPDVAGWHMFALQVTGIIGNLGGPQLLHIAPNERVAGVLPGVLFLIAVTGMALIPGISLLWMALIGLAKGAAFAMAMTFIGVRADDLIVAGRLSGMAQSIGYAIASISLFVTGILADIHTLAILGFIAGLALVLIFAGVLAGKREVIST